MGTDRRLFLAAALDDDTRHALATFVSAPGMPEIPGRRVPPPNWHITLRFLGRSTSVQQELVLATLDEELDVSAFEIGFGGIGAFPYPAKATVVWLAVEHGGQELDHGGVAGHRADRHVVVEAVVGHQGHRFLLVLAADGSDEIVDDLFRAHD